MPTLLLIHRDAGQVTNVPFVFKSGEMTVAVENIADYIAGAGLVDSLWEAVAADRLGIILRQQQQLKEAAKAIAELKEWSAFVGHPVQEVAR